MYHHIPRAKTLSALLTIVCAVVVMNNATARTKRIFFAGNSYTYTNSMPDMLKALATAMGDTVVYAMSAPGGHTFQQHTTNTTTLTGITSQPWDIVILQEQSQIPSFPPAQVATDCYPYARWLDSFINDYDSCIETMFMMTWGRKNGDAMNCASYPVVCTYAGMQGRLRESYLEMTMNNHASVAPVGAAWKVVVDSFPAIELYQPDESHPSVAGSYLEACVLYASAFHRSPEGCSYVSSLTPSVAATLQRIAARVTLDSLEQWQQYGHYPHAAFTYALTTPATVNLTNTSQRADSYVWQFGDGGTAATASPSHTYTASGTYTITLTATNDCSSNISTDTVTVTGTTGIDNIHSSSNVMIMNSGNGHISFVLPGAGHLSVYDINGRTIRSYDRTANAQVTDMFPAGLYLYRFTTTEGSITGKFSTY